MIVIRQTPSQANLRNPKRLQIKHACEDGAERALAVVAELAPEHRSGAMRIIREAIDQAIGKRSASAAANSKTNQSVEAVFGKRSAKVA